MTHKGALALHDLKQHPYFESWTCPDSGVERFILSERSHTRDIESDDMMRNCRSTHFVLLVLLAVLAMGLEPLGAAGRRSKSTPLTKDDVLSLREGRFYLDGQPFAEISFNKFDLFWQLYDQLAAGKALNRANPMLLAQDRALRELHQMGFRTIGIFALPWGPRGRTNDVPSSSRWRKPT